MKRKKVLRNLLIILLVIITGAAFYIYKEFNRTHMDTARLSADFSLAAPELIKEFEANEQASNKKYGDRVIRVEGIVKEVEKDDRGFYSLAIGDTTSLSAIRCSMDSVHGSEAAGVQKGSTVCVKGICSGFNADDMLGSDVILVRSVIDSKK